MACAAASPKDDAERVRMGEEYYVLRDLTQSPYFDEVDDDDDDETIAAKMSIWREKMRAPLERAVKLATYIQERGFADYALETSGFAYNFANWAHDKEALKYWGDVLEDISLMQSYESKW
ncbi:SET domain-containing protein 5 [Sporothrix eucalyptigena]|uniref:SET domain-containing protein 5 n=1 Tax=Sporothrix eucalyptigena TaxID=1812306 RepID=A0ABP0BC63_9PEZI